MIFFNLSVQKNRKQSKSDWFLTLFFSIAGVPFIHMSVCFWTAHTLKQAWADEQFVVPAPPNTSAFMQSLLCQCWKPTVSGCIGAHSGSHTHSEPRIVIIFSELLQIDRQTEWVDRQMCTQTDREREDQIGNQEQGWKQGPKLKQANRCPMQETDHHCWNYTGQQLQWIWTHIHIIGWLTEEKQRERGRTEEERTDAMDADFKLNITRSSGRDFLSDLPTPAQNPVLPFKTPPHIFATEVRPESSPRGFTAQLQVFLISSVAIPMSQGRACDAEEKETLWGATKSHASHRCIKMRQVSPYSEQSGVWRVIVKLNSSQIIKKTSNGKCTHRALQHHKSLSCVLQ